MANINLVPDVRLEKIKTKRRNFLVTFSAIVIIVVMVIFILILQAYRIFQKVTLDNTKADIAKTQEELKEYKEVEDMAFNIEQGLKAVESITQDEQKWSAFLPNLEKVTPSDVKFTELDQDSGVFKAKAKGKTVESIGRTVKSMEGFSIAKSTDDPNPQKLFKNIEVKGYKKEADGLISFDITFEIEKGLLW